MALIIGVKRPANISMQVCCEVKFRIHFRMVSLPNRW